jgi:high frequency lysogenization protein
MSDTPHQSLHNQMLALAGVAQFALYAHELAADGRDITARLDIARRVIFCTDPDTVMDVFGDLANLDDGRAYLRQHLAGRKPDSKATAIARYIGQILRLSGKLMKNDAAVTRLRAAIDRARAAETADVPEILDAGYREAISPLKPRIMLHGHPSYLRNEAIQARVRTHLMAAIRCGVLWRQCRGRFLSLFFRRKALLSALDHT